VQQEPDLLEADPGHRVRCFIYDPATSHLWEGVQRTDWRFTGDEVFAPAPVEEGAIAVAGVAGGDSDGL
jgi:hypothetical protein